MLYPSFALAVLVTTGPFWYSLTFDGAALALTAFVTIVLSIMTHEFAHFTVARLFGTSLARIDVFALGSTAQLAAPPERQSPAPCDCVCGTGVEPGAGVDRMPAARAAA